MSKRWIGAVLAAGVLLAYGAPAHADVGQRTGQAARYIVSFQEDDGSIWGGTAFGSPLTETADAVVSLVAAGRGAGAVGDALDYLEAHVGEATTVGRKAKLVLAAVAGGRNPRNVGGQDLVAAIEGSVQPDGHYGDDPSFTTVLHHALAVLALDAAGVDVPRSALRWLAEAQCRDGGWQFDDPAAPGDDRHCGNGGEFDATSDTNTTAYVVQAFEAVPTSVSLDKDPFDFFGARRDEIKGGWGYDRTYFLTEPVSTSLVLQAYASADREPPKGARAALRALQYRLCGRGGGAFASGWAVEGLTGDKYRRAPRSLGATVAGILGLLEQPLPVHPAGFLTSVPRVKPCP